jgi:hypothetical protein
MMNKPIHKMTTRELNKEYNSLQFRMRELSWDVSQVRRLCQIEREMEDRGLIAVPDFKFEAVS